MLKLQVVAPAVDQDAISNLFDNLDLILANKHKILSCKKYHDIQIPGVFVGGLYVGMHQLSLGDILILWDTTEWHQNTKYYYNIIGTPLSGMNTSHWYDTKTKQFNSGAYFNGKTHFLGLAGPALKYLEKTKGINSCIAGLKDALLPKQQEPIQSNLTIFDLVQKLK